MQMDDKLLERKKASRAGRRSAILFDSVWKRDFFLHVAQILLDKYYDHDPSNTKKNMVFSESRRMGKTQFWACIHLICRKRGILNNDPNNHNLEPFVEFLQATYGIGMVGERSVISKSENQLIERHANTRMPLDYLSDAKQEKAEKSREIYQTVEQYWDEAEKEMRASNI